MGERKEQRKVRHKELQEKIKNATSLVVIKIAEATGLDKVFTRLLSWAEKHRKAMGMVTISFLVFVFLVTIIQRPSRGTFGKTYTEVESAIQTDSLTTFEALKNKERSITKNIELMLLLQKLRSELSQIYAKGELSQADSLRLTEIYNIITQHGNEPKQD